MVFLNLEWAPDSLEKIIGLFVISLKVAVEFKQDRVTSRKIVGLLFLHEAPKT